MKFSRAVPWLVLTLFFSACASVQTPVALKSGALAAPARIGVAMTPMPQAGTYIWHAQNCVLCYAAGMSSFAGLGEHLKTVSTYRLSQLKIEMAALAKQNGARVVLIDEALDPESFPTADARLPDSARRDFSSLRRKYDIDKLLVVQIDWLGASRYYSYRGLEEPLASVWGSAYLINLNNHTYEWYIPLAVDLKTSADWNKAPYTVFTDRYIQAMETSRNYLLAPLKTAPSDGHR